MAALQKPETGFGSAERVRACQFLANDQLVHGLGALVGNNAFEVQHVTNRHVLRTDARAAKMSRASRAMSSAARQLFHLASDTCVGCN